MYGVMDIGKELQAAFDDGYAERDKEIVRCRECKHGITGHGITDGWVLCSKSYATDTVGGAMHRCDWFCADGKRKDGEK